MTLLQDGVLSYNMEELLQQIRDQITEVQVHGFGRVEIIVRDGEVTTLHSQKTWVRRAPRSDVPKAPSRVPGY